MKQAVIGLLGALGLFVVGAACWSEAQFTRQMGEAHRRLATLHYDVEDSVGEPSTLWGRLPWSAVSSETALQRHRATVSYWLARFDALTDLSLATGAATLTDPHMMLVAANAAWRQVPPPEGNRNATLQRLDTVIQAYAEVLRRDPGASEAAFNYEFVSKVRDTVAKAAPAKAAKGAARDAGPAEIPSVDLPTGPTVHGWPGGPPEGTDMSDFKTIAPMRYDEREEQMAPGRGGELKRKG